MKRNVETPSCRCGGISGPHLIGDDGCKRELCEAPTMVKKGHHPWYDAWLVMPGPAEISGFTLLHQRVYHDHGGGLWSRPIGGGSQNSLEA